MDRDISVEPNSGPTKAMLTLHLINGLVERADYA